MKRTLTLIAGLLLVFGVRAQEKDTLEVQKIGDKYFLIVDHKAPDTVKYVAVNEHKKFDSHFMVGGLVTVGFNHTITALTSGGITTKSKSNNIGDRDNFEFSPMLLWRHGDKFLLEFEPSFTADGLGVNWANISYFVTPGVIIRAGYLVLPFGTYSKRLAAGWINKLNYDPIGATMAPVGADWGVELSGGAQVGKMKINYDLAVANGFNLAADGQVSNPGLTANNNIAKTVVGRFGWLPMSNSALEIGVSGLYSRAGLDTGANRKVSTIMAAADLQYIYAKKPIQITLKGQYNMGYVTKYRYTNPSDTTGATSYNFTNFSYGYYAMLAFRPISNNKVFRNFELAGRYSEYHTPTGAAWENHMRQVDVAIDYWINWRTVVKLSYENFLQSNPMNSNIGLSDNKSLQHIIQVQFSIQL
jgi:hypothetical protein